MVHRASGIGAGEGHGAGPLVADRICPPCCLSVVGMEMKLELVMVPVTDVDRAKDFYAQVGFTVDHDQHGE